MVISPYPHINLSIFYLVLHRLGICMDGPVINPCLYRLGVDVKSRAILVRVPSPVYRFPLFGPFCKQNDKMTNDKNIQKVSSVG